MRSYFLFFATFITMSACNSNTSKETVAPVEQKDTTTKASGQPVTVVEKDSIMLQNVELNEKTVLNKKNISALDRSLQKKYSIRKLDSLESDGFKYFIYDTLYSGKETTVLLISRKWPEENIVWLVIYDAAMNLMDQKQVYYDNSEGYLAIETSISNNQVKITTDNIYEESANTKKTVTWFIDANNKLVKK